MVKPKQESRVGEEIFVGNSEMAGLMRDFDWSQTSLGKVETWSQSLKITLSILLTSRQPMFLWWGEELIQFYNDGFRPSLGTDRHPQALGHKAREFWHDAWHIVGEQVDAAIERGESTWKENQLVPIIRNGCLEEVYWTYSHSPLRDDDGHINGVLAVCTETTEQVIGQRQLQIQGKLATQTVGVKTVEQACEISARTLANHSDDVPFALLYLLDETGSKAKLAGITGLDAGTFATPQEIEINSENNQDSNCNLWSLSAAMTTGESQIVEGLQSKFGLFPGAPSKSPDAAVVVPLIAPAQAQVKGFLIAGISPKRPFNKSYKGFFDLISAQIASAISNARAWETERSLDEIRETARRSTEAANSKIQEVLSSIRDGFVQIDYNWRFNYINNRQLQIIGMKREDVLGKNLWEVFEDLVSSEFDYCVREVMVKRTPAYFEFYYPTWNRWFENRVYPTPEGIAIICADITEQKQATAALSESEARFRQMAETIENVFWLHDLQTDKLLYLSPAFEQIWGRSHQYIYNDSRKLIETIHPEHREHMQTAPARCLANNGNIEEYRIIRPDGSIRWIRDRGFVVNDENGQPYRLAGVAEDITAEKQASEALRESERRLRRLVESNMFGVVIGDSFGGLRYANDYLLNMIGYTSAEIDNGEVRWNELTPPEFAPLDAKAIEELINQGVCTPYEKVYLHKDGRQIPILIGAAFLDEPFNQDREIVAFVIDLTNLKQVTEERDRFFNLSEDMMVIANFEGYFTQVNPAWEKKLGWTPTEITAKPYIEFIHPDDRSLTLAQAQKLATGINAIGFENRYIAKDGSYHWLSWSASSFPEQEIFYCVARDVTEQKQSEIKLEQLAALVDNSADFIGLATPEGKGLYVNPAGCQLVGLENLEAALETEISDYFFPEDKAYVQQVILPTQIREGFWHSEMNFRHFQTGEAIPVDYSAFAIRDPHNNEIVAFATVTRDIRERVAMQQERDRILQREQAARETAEQANRIKDEFLAVLSHELRTPLNPILGWAKILQKGHVDANKTKMALETIERNAKLQTQLIDDLLDISRIIRGKLSLNKAPVNLANAIEFALETVRLSAEAKSIKIHTAKSSLIPIVNGDRGRLQQVIWNLLSNAVKFTPKGGHISIQLTQVENYAQIQVKDRGIGINKDFLPYIFEHFRQENSAITRKFGGLGLGLAIVRQLVELHGGTVKADSPGVGQGATFIVEIPTLTAKNNTDVFPETNQPPSNLSGINILVVDDEPDSRDLIAFILQQEGATINTAASASEALEIIAELTPDLLISDIGMPEMDGYKLIEIIRASKKILSIPAIALTAYASENDEQKAIAAGFQQHISKPIDANTIVDIVVKLLNN